MYSYIVHMHNSPQAEPQIRHQPNKHKRELPKTGIKSQAELESLLTRGRKRIKIYLSYLLTCRCGA